MISLRSFCINTLINSVIQHQINTQVFLSFSSSYTINVLLLLLSLHSCYGVRALNKASMANSDSIPFAPIDTFEYLGDVPTNKYYLHHGDSLGAILVSQSLVGDNYHT